MNKIIRKAKRTFYWLLVEINKCSALRDYSLGVTSYSEE